MALERSPATFSRMKEEELRDQFLVPLNSHYEGQATGETFNASGRWPVDEATDGKRISPTTALIVLTGLWGVFLIMTLFEGAPGWAFRNLVVTYLGHAAVIGIYAFDDRSFPLGLGILILWIGLMAGWCSPAEI